MNDLYVILDEYGTAHGAFDTPEEALAAEERMLVAQVDHLAYIPNTYVTQTPYNGTRRWLNG